MSPQEPPLPGFGRGDFEESRRVESAPKMELTALPQSAKKKSEPSLTFSCDSLEERDELVARIAELGYTIEVDRRKKIWTAEVEQQEDIASDDPLIDL